MKYGGLHMTMSLPSASGVARHFGLDHDHSEAGTGSSSGAGSGSDSY